LHHRGEDAGDDEENRNSEDCRSAEHAPLDEVYATIMLQFMLSSRIGQPVGVLPHGMTPR